MNMRNETCVETQTSKVPTRVAFLFISILWLNHARGQERGINKVSHVVLLIVYNWFMLRLFYCILFALKAKSGFITFSYKYVIVTVS